jgi:putative hemolysin
MMERLLDPGSFIVSAASLPALPHNAGAVAEVYLTLAGAMASAGLSLLFSTLTYSLREFSRPRLIDQLEKRGLSEERIELTLDRISDFVFVTAVCRLLSNILVLISVLHLLHLGGTDGPVQYALAILITGIITLFVSVAVPHAIATHAAERFIAFLIQFLYGLRMVLLPATRLMHGIDRLVARAIGVSTDPLRAQIEEEIEQELLSVVEEGAKEGVVDDEEREMIESVIEFRDTHVGQSMTARRDIIALPISADLEQVKSVVEESGHSRIPVYEDNLDRIVGVLYARDLLKHLGEPPEKFQIRSAMRPAFFVPATKPLRDLLHDFRVQKVHMAIVLDEYGGTAGVATIEDVLEELVGEISDEHEPAEPAMLRRIDDHTAEVDARMYLDQLNRLLELDLPEDEGYETLGGFVSNTLGRIPQAGTTFDHGRARYTILEAEPQRVSKVRIELLPQAVPGDGGPR